MKKLALIGDCDSGMLKKATVFLTQHHEDDVQIFLSTHGGCFYSALGIYDLMKMHKNALQIVCVGPVFSSGVIILAAGKERVAFENTSFLIHYGSSSVENLSEKKQEDRMIKLYKDILDKSSTVSRRVVSQWLNSEIYMDVKRAKLAGLIDRIEYSS